MTSKPLLTVLLPAYCEAENLRELLPSIQKTLGSLGIPTEILVVDATESGPTGAGPAMKIIHTRKK